MTLRLIIAILMLLIFVSLICITMRWIKRVDTNYQIEKSKNESEHDIQVIKDFALSYMNDQAEGLDCKNCKADDCIECFRDRYIAQMKGTNNG